LKLGQLLHSAMDSSPPLRLSYQMWFPKALFGNHK
jgi:hypothetical protein